MAITGDGEENGASPCHHMPKCRHSRLNMNSTLLPLNTSKLPNFLLRGSLRSKSSQHVGWNLECLKEEGQERAADQLRRRSEDKARERVQHTFRMLA